MALAAPSFKIISHKVIVLLIGVLLGILLTWLIQPFNSARIKFIEGYASVNGNGDAIGFHLDKNDKQQELYSIAGVDWRSLDGVVHQSTNSYSCLKPLDEERKVRLGIVKIIPSGMFPGGSKVVTLECLD